MNENYSANSIPPPYRSRQNPNRIFSRILSAMCLSAGEIILIAVLSFILAASAEPAAAAEISLPDVLPEYGFAEDWAREEEPKLFHKDTLFNHIDGEAEIYFPYGFEALVTANYANKGNRDLSIVADVYKMGSVFDAFGIYSNYRKAKNSWITIGTEGFISSSQLMFYQDRYFVRLQFSGGTDLSRETFLALAKAISGNLPAEAREPRELNVLRISELVPKSERYMAQSLLGYVFFRRGIIADAAVQNEKLQIFVVFEDSSVIARRTFDQYAAYLRTEGKDLQITGNNSRMHLAAVDPLYGEVIAEQTGKYVVGAVRIKNKQLAVRFIEELYGQIRTDKDR